ncbi:MAG: DegT/DnrJ/EryC1/StrS family aminotransferase [Acidobacteriaceae bacterium]
MKIPFVDLRALHSSIEPELLEVFHRVMSNSSFVLGPEVEEFERAFASYLGVRHCVGVSNGTAALQLALASLGIGAGDEVITVAHTFIATAEAISAVGATPVFVDIDPLSYTMDASRLEEAITKYTRAIIPVHLYGQTADMDAILEVAQAHGLAVVEDACQAHGAEYKGKKAGSLGTLGCFSFYPGKNLGACGEGGAVVTNDSELAQLLRMWRDHGAQKKYEHQFPGLNLRMEGLQGGILAVKLAHLDRWNAQRREAAVLYGSLLEGSPLVRPAEASYGEHVYHLYVIQSDDRDGLRQQLNGAGIETGIHYPVPVHLQQAYRSCGYSRGDLPVTEMLAERILSLPMYPGISSGAVEKVAAELCLSAVR